MYNCEVTFALLSTLNTHVAEVRAALALRLRQSLNCFVQVKFRTMLLPMSKENPSIGRLLPSAVSS